MSIKNQEELEGLREVGRIVASTLKRMLALVRPGITTQELDDLGRQHFEARGARSAPRLTYGFPGATCISLNHEAAHGIPKDRRVCAGDLINIDVSLELNGYFADTGASMCVEPARTELGDLCRASKEVLSAALSQIRPGSRINSIGRTIEQESNRRGYRVIRNLAGHGVGRALHEEPADILNYCDPRDKRTLHEGQVIAVETFVSTGADFVMEAEDGWTLLTPDQSYVAQFEHTIIVSRGGPVLVTA